MIGTENDWVELKKGGKGTFFSGFAFDMKWELEGENFTGTVTFLGMEEYLVGTLKDGVLTASYGDISYVFAKEGAEAPAENAAPDAAATGSSKAEAGPDTATEAPADDSFFAAGTEWNGWIMKGEDVIDAKASLALDPATNKMYFDVNTFKHIHFYDQANHVFRDVIDDELVQMIESHLSRKKVKGYKIESFDIQLVGRPTRKKYSVG